MNLYVINQQASQPAGANYKKTIKFSDLNKGVSVAIFSTRLMKKYSQTIFLLLEKVYRGII